MELHLTLWSLQRRPGFFELMVRGKKSQVNTARVLLHRVSVRASSSQLYLSVAATGLQRQRQRHRGCLCCWWGKKSQVGPARFMLHGVSMRA